MKKITFTIVLIIWWAKELFAQDSDFLRSTGKIYCVYAVVLILFLGFIVYLFSLDKKISKIEKKLKDE